MLSLSIATRIFVALEPVDMRQNFNGLYARVQSVLHGLGRLGAVGVYQTTRERDLRLAHRGRFEPLFASRRTEPADPWLGRDASPVVSGLNLSLQFH